MARSNRKVMVFIWYLHWRDNLKLLKLSIIFYNKYVINVKISTSDQSFWYLVKFIKLPEVTIESLAARHWRGHLVPQRHRGRDFWGRRGGVRRNPWRNAAQGGHSRTALLVYWPRTRESFSVRGRLKFYVINTSRMFHTSKGTNKLLIFMYSLCSLVMLFYMTEKDRLGVFLPI